MGKTAMEDDQQGIAARLVALNEQVDVRELFPTLVPEAAELVPGNPYAFCLIPYWIKQLLGHLDPHLVYQMPIDRLEDLVDRLPQKPRYVNAAPRTIQDITKIVVEQFGGDARRIWTNKKATDVRMVFESVYGVGSGIANMAVLLIERGYSIRFSDLDHSRMDIKPDVHTMRVLYRLGVASSVNEDAAIAAARRLNPSYPGELDAPLWLIGRKWCTSSAPACVSCPLKEVCAQIIA